MFCVDLFYFGYFGVRRAMRRYLENGFEICQTSTAILSRTV